MHPTQGHQVGQLSTIEKRRCCNHPPRLRCDIIALPSKSLRFFSRTEAKLTCTLLFSLPVLSALLLLLYLFYLRYRVDLGSLRTPCPVQPDPRPFAAAELDLNEELRDMLPVLIYKENFSVKDTQFSVCLGDYNAEDRLQQIPACGQASHMECIDPSFYANNLFPLPCLSSCYSHI